MAINFNGKRLVKPQAELKLDTSALVGAGTNIGQSLCLIGTCSGGTPKTVLNFTSSVNAVSTLRSGDLLTGAKIAWNPSPSLAGASEIKCVRVNPAVAASVDLNDSGILPVLTVTANDAGIWTNSIDCTVTPASSRKVIAGSGMLGVRLESVSDNAAIGTKALTKGTTTLQLGSGTPVAFGSGGSLRLIDADGAYINVFVVTADLQTVVDGTISNLAIVAQGIKFRANYSTSVFDEQDNLGSVMSVRSPGTSACAITIVVDGVTGFATSISTTGAIVVSIDLTDTRYDSIVEIANHLTEKGFVVTLANSLRNSALSSKYLDAVSAVSIANNNFILTANLGSIIDWSTRSASLVSVAKKTAPSANMPKPVNAKALTGGSEGTTTTADWTAVLTALEIEDVDMIVPLTSDAAIHALVKAHVDAMSLRKKERRAYYGHALSDTVMDLKTRQAALNDRRSMLVTPGIELRDAAGNVTLLNSSFTAAACAGLIAGFTSVADSLTYKFINALGLEKTYTDLEIDDLIEHGIVPVEKVKNRGFRISYGRTTYTYDDISVNVEDSVSRIGDFITVDVRSQLENTFVGIRATKENITAVKVFVTNILKVYEKSGLIVGGIDPVTGQAQQAYSAITVEFADRACYVSFQVSPVEPMNYILITAAFKPNTISA